jgi:predicted GNAT family acetyltransferase
MGKRDDYIEGKLNSIQMGTTLYIEENDQIISTVATTAETTKNAMVVSVATAPTHRHQGLASALLLELMDIYINTKKKSLCLFYDNPEAGKIYLKLGFQTIGKWSMYFSQKDHD